MDKRVLIAAGLSVLIIVAWSYLFPPPEQPAAPQPPVTSAPAELQAEDPSQQEQAPLREVTPPPAEGAPLPDAREATSVEVFHFESDLFEVEMDNRGGRVLSWRLREYRDGAGAPLELFPRFEDQEATLLHVELEDAVLADVINDALFQIDEQPVYADSSGGSGRRVSFNWADGRGIEVRKDLTFRDGSYLVEVELEVTDRGRPLQAGLLLGPGFGAQEAEDGRSTYYYQNQGVWNVGGRVTRLKPRKITDEPGGFRGEPTWAGLEDQYFTALVIPNGQPTTVTWRPLELTRIPLAQTDEIPEAAREPLMAVSIPSEGALLFIGPKKFRLLQSLGHDLSQAVWFATNPMLAWFARTIFIALLWLHDNTIQNYGMAIILGRTAGRARPPSSTWRS